MELLLPYDEPLMRIRGSKFDEQKYRKGFFNHIVQFSKVGAHILTILATALDSNNNIVAQKEVKVTLTVEKDINDVMKDCKNELDVKLAKADPSSPILVQEPALFKVDAIGCDRFKLTVNLVQQYFDAPKDTNPIVAMSRVGFVQFEDRNASSNQVALLFTRPGEQKVTLNFTASYDSQRVTSKQYTFSFFISENSSPTAYDPSKITATLTTTSKYNKFVGLTVNLPDNVCGTQITSSNPFPEYDLKFPGNLKRNAGLYIMSWRPYPYLQWSHWVNEWIPDLPSYYTGENYANISFSSGNTAWVEPKPGLSTFAVTHYCKILKQVPGTYYSEIIYVMGTVLPVSFNY